MYKILDCTLRDGGYYNNWDFGDDLTLTYFKAMENLPVEFVEVGYRSNVQQGYEGKYFYCPVFVLERSRALMPGKKIAIMLNERAVTPGDVPRLLTPCKGLVDMVRIAVAPARLRDGFELAKAVRTAGFDVALNLMYMSKLLDEKANPIFDQLPQMEDVVSSFSLVDSFGGVYPEDVTRLITKCKGLTRLPIGFHGHNNIELAFANALAAISAGCDIVDATVMGMGRGAGNLRTELLLTHQSTREGVTIDFNHLADVVTGFEELHQQYNWGTNLPYMVSGANSLSQKEVMDLVQKRAYSINSIIRGLNNQSKGQEDNIKLPLFVSEKNFDVAVIIGGGHEAIKHAEAVKKFIAQHNSVCLIHASAKNSWAYDDIDVPQYFCLVGNEGHRLEAVFNNANAVMPICVLPPFPRKMGTYIPEEIAHQSFELSKVDIVEDYKDSHTALALQLARELNVKSLFVTGYDGYQAQSATQKEQELFSENNYMFSKAAPAFENITSLTATYYKALKTQSVYSLIS